MGRGIGLFFYLNHYDVSLYDTNADALIRAKNYFNEKISNSDIRIKAKKANSTESNHTSLLEFSDDLERSIQNADYIIEAAPEIPELKINLFKKIEKYALQDTVIATNTSTISVEYLSQELINPERFIGMHFFNPAEKMKLVELIPVKKTSIKIVEEIIKMLNGEGKKTVVVQRDRPGFIVNRIIAPTQILTNAILEEKIITPESFDAHFESMPGMPPFEMLDFVGLDIAVHTMDYYTENLHTDFASGNILRKKIESHDLGKKTGKGIYLWVNDKPIKKAVSNEKSDILPLHLKAAMVNEAFRVFEEKTAASKKDIDRGIQYGLNQRPVFRSLNNEKLKEVVHALEYLHDRFDISYFKPSRVLLEEA